MKTLHLSIIIISISGLLVGASNSIYSPCLVGVIDCGPPPGVTVSTGTDSQFYEKNDTIDVQGQVYVQNYSKPIPVQVVNPENVTVQSTDAPVTNGKFGLKIGANFDKTGFYQIITCVQSWCDRSYFKFVAQPYKLTVNSQDYFIKYKSVADLEKIEADNGVKALRIHIANATAQGLQFVIELPRNLIDSKSQNNVDMNFTVLVGENQPDKFMQNVNFKEIATTSYSRTLQIDIPYDPIPDVQGIWDIKITGTTFLGTNTTVLSPLKQFKSGIAAKDVTCNQGLELIFRSEDNSPACVKPDTANILNERGWATVITNPSDNSVTKTPYNGIDKPSGIILLENQTYYMTTFNGTLDSLPSNGTEISFHGVQFTLMRPPESTANGLLYVVDVKFISDNTNESLVIYPVGVGAVQADKALSKHLHPQAGFIVYQYNTMKLLVSTDVDTTNTQTKTSYPSSALKLYFTTSSQVLRPGQPIGITISVNNTLSSQVMVQDENSWKLNNLSLNPCTSTPYGIVILDGFYSEQNMTEGKPLTIFSPDALCPVYSKTTQSYVFQPSSAHVTLNNCTDTPSTCSSGFGMGDQLSLNGIWNSGQIEPFKSGLYTIVGGDEWGHVAIEHFVVTNSTIFAGNLGSMSCPLMYGGVQFGATIKNLTGFANYYNSTQYGYTFFLHPGMKGTISVQYSAPANAAWFQNNGNAPFNITNGATLFYTASVTNAKSTISYAVSLSNDKRGHHSLICHYGMPFGGFEEPCNTDNTGDIPLGELPDASRLLHVGIDTSFEPISVMLYPDSNPVFTATVSANSNAMPGTYWLSLEWSLCGPGVLAKLVVLP